MAVRRLFLVALLALTTSGCVSGFGMGESVAIALKGGDVANDAWVYPGPKRGLYLMTTALFELPVFPLVFVTAPLGFFTSLFFNWSMLIEEEESEPDPGIESHREAAPEHPPEEPPTAPEGLPPDG